jgi:hypothetical protein
MTNERISLSRVFVLCCLLLLSCPTASSQSIDRGAVQKTFFETVAERDQFIAALEWSVDKQKEYVWPFESMRPARYASVRLVIDQMPRAWPESGSSKGSVSLSASRSLLVNGNKLPKPQRSGSREDYLVDLVDGRLRFSFVVPPGLKLDNQNSIIRIRLYRA